MSKQRWTTLGPVRGGCGHAHKTIGLALRCLIAEMRDCCREGCFSDRMVYEFVGSSRGTPIRLDSEEPGYAYTGRANWLPVTRVTNDALDRAK